MAMTRSSFNTIVHSPHPTKLSEHPVVQLISTISKKPLNIEEMQFIIAKNPVKVFKKGAYLLREGEISKHCYFNFKGLVRQYYIKDGSEITVEFFTDMQPVTATLSHVYGVPSKYNLECIEDCTMSMLEEQDEKDLYRMFPHFETTCRIELEKMHGEYQEKMTQYIHSTPEERYLNVLDTRPDLLHRVPQYQLASYLGIKPESLSRIRKRLASKK